jgi:hypothetical protein
MAVIEIDERVAEALRAQASVRELSLGAFLQQLAEAASPVNPTAVLTPADFDRSIDELVSETGGLPSNFSRADIYADHD